MRTSRVGSSAKCNVCHAGQLISFNWSNTARADSFTPRTPERSAFGSPEPLRRGALYRCRACGSTWHHDEAEQQMSHVADRCLPLVREWNAHPILLSAHLAARLRVIGPTPPDIYGNGRQYEETPCGVVTVSGERIDVAVVSRQQ